MAQQRNTTLILKTLLIGVVVTSLIYFFHPGVGQFSLVINGEPVAEPLVRFAAIPTLLIALFLTGVLMFFAFLGVSMFMFFAVLGGIMLTTLMLAPYFWPLLLIIFLIILLMAYKDH